MKFARLLLSSRGLDTDDGCSDCCLVDSLGGARSRRLPNMVAVTRNTQITSVTVNEIISELKKDGLLTEKNLYTKS